MVANSREIHFLRRGDVHFALDSRSRRALVSRFLASIASAQMMMVESTNASLAFDLMAGARKKKAHAEVPSLLSALIDHVDTSCPRQE